MPGWVKRANASSFRFCDLLEKIQIAEAPKPGYRVLSNAAQVGFDALKHMVLCRIERRPSRLDMTVYPYILESPCRGHIRRRGYIALLSGDLDF